MTKQNQSSVDLTPAEFDTALDAHNVPVEQHEQEVDDLPWNDVQPVVGRELVPVNEHNLMLVQGIEIDPSLPEEEKDRLLFMITSYTGVIPRPIDGYIGSPIEMIGCCVVPIEDMKVDEETGEVVSHKRWKAALFKLAARDDRTGEHIILSGGGKQGMMFANSAISLYGAGDWKTPKSVRIYQEARTGRDGNPRRMYRFQFLGRV